MEPEDKNAHRSNTFNDLESESGAEEAATIPREGSEANRPSEDLQPTAAPDLGVPPAATAEELQALQDRHLRLAAEFDNYKKLALRDQREHVRFANERLLNELLPVIDNLERAIQSGKKRAGGEALVEGVELTLKQALEVLGKFGLQQMETVGRPFDPAYHQAVTKVGSQTVPANSIVEEFQRGYLLHDRVLRAAMVSVATPPGSASDGGEEQSDLQGGPAEAPDAAAR